MLTLRPWKWMRSLRRLLPVAVLLLSGNVMAQQRSVAELGEQLRSSSDFRVRTQAALALGASDSNAALLPLCSALDDASEAVRSAAAAALGRLGKAEGVACLERHSRDASAAVRSVVERSLSSLRASGRPGKPPLPRPDDKYYVAIGTITDKSGRADGSVVALVQSMMQRKLLGMKGCAVAPAGESAAEGRRVTQKNHLKGFMLQVRVEPMRQNGSDLTVQVRVTLWSYPEKALQGEFSPKLTMSGASIGDRSSEDELLGMAIEKAVESFSTVAASAK